MPLNRQQLLFCPRSAVSILIIMFGAMAAIASPAAHAQAALTVPPFTTMISVAPVIAGPNTPRTITVSGQWPNSCVPVSATLNDDSHPGTPPIIRMQLPLTLAPCLLAITAYSRQVSFTPLQGGARRLIAVTSDGRFLAQGDLVTQESAKARSLYDLTGAWYDPLTSGSGLTFVHSFYASDVLVGGWYFYDSQGKSRWVGIQMGEWATPSLFVAKLLEHDALPGGCATGVTACPLPSSSYRQFGTVRIQVIDRDHAVIDASTIMGGDIVNPLFRSTITRLAF